MNKIPCIDLTPARTGGEQGKRDVAEQISKACREIGFLTVKGHGIDRKVFEDAYEVLNSFFALPVEEKNECRTDERPVPHQRNGYAGLLEENAHALMGKENMPSDYVEKFSMGKHLLDDAMNLPFPKGEQGVKMRGAMKRYYEACNEMTQMFTELFAIAIDLPRDFFDDKIDEACDFLRMQNYPDLGPEHENDQGLAEHTDSILFTMLTGTEGGLEVKNLDGDWIRVKPDDIDHFVCNVGDLLMRWSNDEWISTPHRVVLTPNARQSIIFFKVVNEDTLIECFPKFCKDRPSKYQPVIFTEYLQELVKKLYGE